METDLMIRSVKGVMKAGEILFDKYRIERRLGTGGMSEVYLCSSLRTGSKWAVKHIQRSKTGEKLLSIEENILKQLNHTNLPKIVDIFYDASGSYIVESYIEGTTLDGKLRQCRGISLETKLEWALELCDILGYLHGLKPYPVIYGDMKPSNIMVTPDNRVVLVDFGISKEYTASGERGGILAGTRCFAAPEQLLAGHCADQRSDIYGLGVTLHILFYGSLPDNAGSPKRKRRNRTEERLYRIIGRCIEADAEARYQSVGQLREELRQIRNSCIGMIGRKHTGIRVCFGATILLSLATYISAALGLLALKRR